MKILHVTNAVGWSGGMEQMFLLIGELLKKGHTNFLACPAESQIAERFKDSGIKILPVKMFQDYDLVSAWKIRKFVKENQPDIVHAHHAIAHAVTLIALLGLSKPPLIVSRRVSFKPRKNPFSIFKYRSSRIDRYTVVSRSVMETLVQSGIPAEKISVIYSAVQPEKFAAQGKNAMLLKELQIPEGSPVVVKLANFSRWKGQHIFLEAAKACLAKDPKIIFILVGKETDLLDAEAAKLGLLRSVRLLGFRKDVPDILSLADLSVNSAIEGEGLSGALRESLAMGIPVIASDVAGNRELVRDGETGLLVPVGDSGVLAEKILFALSNRASMKSMAQKGREWVMANASIDKAVSDHLSLYESLLSGSSS